ncbi:protein phosphatase 2C domain-containing protein [Kitasatospora sp. NBC_00070]|uniref:protein phosphatase 2C domain-containing protein n=1 Tax=Kitasatospora sp. NBC_00070 TaxID=2975962 RepID=UPI0032513CB5
MTGVGHRRSGARAPGRRSQVRLAVSTLVVAALMIGFGGAMAGAKGFAVGVSGALLTAGAAVLVAVQRASAARSRGQEEPAPEAVVPPTPAPPASAAPGGERPADPAPQPVPPQPVPRRPVPPQPVRRPDPVGSVFDFPVLGRPSQTAAAPWRLPGRPAPSGIAADRATLGDLTVLAASVVGPGHRCDAAGQPRQDAYRLGQDTAQRHLVIAVADGMSDSEHAEVGANVAVTAAVGALRAALDQGAGIEQLAATVPFRAAAGQMLGAAEQRGWTADQVRAVLVVAVVEARPRVDGTRLAWLAAIADVSAWRRHPTGWDRLIGDDKSGFDAGRVAHFLPHEPDAAQQRLYTLGPGDVLALMTDGVSDVFGQLPGAEGWFAERWAAPPPVARFLLEVGYEESQFNDDRTAVVVWCGATDRGERR